MCVCVYEGEMLITTQPTTLLEIFYKIIFNSHVIAKSTIEPEDLFGMHESNLLILEHSSCNCSLIQC